MDVRYNAGTGSRKTSHVDVRIKPAPYVKPEVDLTIHSIASEKPIGSVTMSQK